MHLAVLTSDNAWKLYNVADLSLPEQSFALRLEPRRFTPTPPPCTCWWCQAVT